jgi:hypothetical protein
LLITQKLPPHLNFTENKEEGYFHEIFWYEVSLFYQKDGPATILDNHNKIFKSALYLTLDKVLIPLKSILTEVYQK